MTGGKARARPFRRPSPSCPRLWASTSSRSAEERRGSRPCAALRPGCRGTRGTPRAARSPAPLRHARACGQPRLPVALKKDVDPGPALRSGRDDAELGAPRAARSPVPLRHARACGHPRLPVAPKKDVDPGPALRSGRDVAELGAPRARPAHRPHSVMPASAGIHVFRRPIENANGRDKPGRSRSRRCGGKDVLPSVLKDQEQPVVLPQVSHFRQVPLRTSVKFWHSGQASPT